MKFLLIFILTLTFTGAHAGKISLRQELKVAVAVNKTLEILDDKGVKYSFKKYNVKKFSKRKTWNRIKKSKKRKSLVGKGLKDLDIGFFGAYRIKGILEELNKSRSIKAAYHEIPNPKTCTDLDKCVFTNIYLYLKNGMKLKIYWKVNLLDRIKRALESRYIYFSFTNYDMKNFNLEKVLQEWRYDVTSYAIESALEPDEIGENWRDITDLGYMSRYDSYSLAADLLYLEEHGFLRGVATRIPPESCEDSTSCSYALMRIYFTNGLRMIIEFDKNKPISHL